MPNILVTGGAGYIGSHTCKALAQHGFTPISYDNLSRGHRSSVKWGPFIEGDLLDCEKLTKTLEDYKIEAVIHFAAFAYVGESTQFPHMYFENNVKGSISLLIAMKDANVDKLIFSSSCATYGEPTTELITEDHPQNPINPYGLSKLMVEKILKQQAEKKELAFCGLRYFNASGADPQMEIGECHDPEPHIIPNILRAAESNEKIFINGNDYPTADGSCVRDFIHVSDLAEAHILPLKKLMENGNTNEDFYNLGSGKSYSLIEVVRNTEKLTNKKIAIEFRPRRPGDPSKLSASSQLFERDFEWKPRYSDLNTVLKTSLRWMRKSQSIPN